MAGKKASKARQHQDAPLAACDVDALGCAAGGVVTPPPASTEVDVRPIHWSQLVPSPYNKRRWLADDAKDQGIAELAASIAAHGRNFQNVVVRPAEAESALAMLTVPATNEAGLTLYEIAAGERRWRAVRLIAARLRANGKDDAQCVVWCEVRELTDEQAFAICMDENKRRQNLSPLEEADTLSAYLEHNKAWTIEQAADALGMSLSAARRRIRLTQLTARWQAVAMEPDSLVRMWPAVMLEKVAALPETVQEELLDDIWDEENRTWAEYVYTLDDLRQLLGGKFLLVQNFPWDLNDPDLGAPACAYCTNRSGCQPDLFDLEDFREQRYGGRQETPKPGDRCLDAACREKKMGNHLFNRENALRKDYKELVLLQSQNPRIDNRFKKPAYRYDWKECASNAQGARMALDLQSGETRWVKHNGIGAEKPTKKTVEKQVVARPEQQAKFLSEARWVLGVRKARAALEAARGDEAIYGQTKRAFAAALLDPEGPGRWPSEDENISERIQHLESEFGIQQLDDLMFGFAIDEILARWKNLERPGMEYGAVEVEGVLALIKADIGQIYRAVAKELPDGTQFDERGRVMGAPADTEEFDEEEEEEDVA